MAISKIVNWRVGTVRYIVKKYKIYGTIEDRTFGPRTGPKPKDIVSPRIQKLANQKDDKNTDSEAQTASNHYGKHFTSGKIQNYQWVSFYKYPF